MVRITRTPRSTCNPYGPGILKSKKEKVEKIRALEQTLNKVQCLGASCHCAVWPREVEGRQAFSVIPWMEKKKFSYEKLSAISDILSQMQSPNLQHL